jgi:16S rRNA G527 N7-methylase RsmG
MKNINQIFKDNYHLMDIPQVEELIDYTRELEGQVFENNLQDVNDKENILKSIIQDVLTSCNELEENKSLNERYPDLYKKIDGDTLIKNLKDYILEVNRVNKLGL